MNSAELTLCLADKAWWMELGYILRWKLYSWTYRDSASFWNSDNKLIEISASTRNDIMEVSASELR